MKIAFISPYSPSRVTLNEYGYHLIRSFSGKAEVEKIYVRTNHLEDNSEYNRYAIDGIELIPCWKFSSLFPACNSSKKSKELQPDEVILNLQFIKFGEGKVPATLGLLTSWLCKLRHILNMVILYNITETVKLDTIGMAGNLSKEKLLLWMDQQLTKIILKAD